MLYAVEGTIPKPFSSGVLDMAILDWSVRVAESEIVEMVVISGSGSSFITIDVDVACQWRSCNVCIIYIDMQELVKTTGRDMSSALTKAVRKLHQHAL